MKNACLSFLCLIIIQIASGQANSIYSTGPVGIGTTTTTNAVLTVNGTGHLLRLENETYGGEAIIRFRSTATDGSYLHTDIAANADAGFLGFKVPYNNTVGSGYKMIINTDGMVGIGTVSPSEKLSVIGNIAFRDRAVRNTTDYIGRAGSLGNNAGWVGFGVDSSYNNYLTFGTLENGLGGGERMRLDYKGNLGIGTASPLAKLDVNGGVRIIGDLSANGFITTKKLTVTQLGWSDYVFNKDYKLRSLSSLETFIKQNKHLPEVPSAKEVEEKGISVGDNQALLLKKIEELTLYIIAQQKEINTLKIQIRKK